MAIGHGDENENVLAMSYEKNWKDMLGLMSKLMLL